MLCSPAKARHLLEGGKAKVVKLNPFVIQLNFECGNKVQKVSLGVDSGYSTTGFSAITDRKEIIAGDLNFDRSTSKRLTERKTYRRNRRNRLRYRKPRFDNRRKPENWLPPSIQRKFDAHVTIVNTLKELLPTSKITVEIGNFDIQKLENPEISGKEYQQGSMLGYNNLKSYLMAREKGKCQLCSKGFTKDNGSHMHHIIPRSQGGTDRSTNVALLHKKCHEKLHKEKLFHKLKKAKQYKAETFMSIVGERFKDVLGCEVTYGYETKTKRDLLGLEKSHVNDAFVIAGGTNQERCGSEIIEQKRRNNRILQTNRKGFAPSIRRRRHPIQNRDFVWISRKKHLCGGVACRGSRVYYFDGLEKKLISSKKVERLYSTSGLVWSS
jgi:5-methylcytosine-specific restriction endonuclease McrA